MIGFQRVTGRTNRAAVWLIVVAGLLLFAGANAHLVYVAVTSQPECVAHPRLDEGGPHGRLLGAAKSECSP
jgi:hypothetical protein